ncbi:MAG: 2-hydroxyacyl-CoA dehydratase [Spongiibacteraceae bacterium]|nr:2-hydroxyacyl-CoA dehydratase [Spongiibacteraceae bacterium]
MQGGITRIGTTLGQRSRSLLEQILNDKNNTPLLITHADSELPQLFASLRELLRTGDMQPRALHFLDFLHLPRASSQTYNALRIQQLTHWLKEITGNCFSSQLWKNALIKNNKALTLLQTAKALRDNTQPQLSSAHVYAMTAAAHILPLNNWRTLMVKAINDAQQCPPLHSGKRIITSGAAQLNEFAHTQLSQAGYQIVGDFQEWGDKALTTIAANDDGIHGLANPARKRPAMLIPAADRAKTLAEHAKQCTAESVLYLVNPGDEPSEWDAGTIQKLLTASGIRTGIWRTHETLANEETLFAMQPPIKANTQAPKHKPEKTKPASNKKKAVKNH